MKSSVIAALLSSTQAISLQSVQSAKMEKVCIDNLNDIALLQIHKDLGIDKFNGNIEETHKEHFGKTKAAVDAENKHILETQAKCLDFVNAHKDHPAVCNWCHEYAKPATGETWQWNPDEGVWYKWYDGSYHYWGPSKEGLKHEWTWYQGYWHHKGYVYRYNGTTWQRFQGGKWTDYKEKLPIDPKPDYTKECRQVMKIEQVHVPDSLTEHNLPRCQVGEGKDKTVYQWTDEADCTFVGGTKVFQKNFECKDGSSEQVRKVEVCIQGPAVSGEGLDYKTGKAKVTTTTTTTTSGGSSGSSTSGSSQVVEHSTERTTRKCTGPLCEEKCYKFQMFDHTGDYLRAAGGKAMASSLGGDEIVWKVTAPHAETTHGVSLARADGTNLLAADGSLAVGSADGQGAAATFLVVNGIAGSGVSLESLANRGQFAMHEAYDPNQSEHALVVQKLTAQEQLKRATFNVEEADCPQ